MYLHRCQGRAIYGELTVERPHRRACECRDASPPLPPARPRLVEADKGDTRNRRTRAIARSRTPQTPRSDVILVLIVREQARGIDAQVALLQQRKRRLERALRGLAVPRQGVQARVRRITQSEDLTQRCVAAADAARNVLPHGARHRRRLVSARRERWQRCWLTPREPRARRTPPEPCAAHPMLPYVPLASRARQCAGGEPSWARSSAEWADPGHR